MSDPFSFEDATPCSYCGARPAGATVEGADLCGSCARIQIEATGETP